MKDEILVEIRRRFEERGASQYGGEPVTQLEHALQTAMLAEADGASAELITAALLHDIGHLLHDLPEDAPDNGVDDVHEHRAYGWLSEHFGEEVTEPIRLHVAAKALPLRRRARVPGVVKPAFAEEFAIARRSIQRERSARVSETAVQ